MIRELKNPYTYMNSRSDMKQSSNIGYILGILLVLVIIGGVGLTAVVLYFINHPVPLTVGPAAERKAKLAEVNANQNDIITSYGWVDQPNGVVRIPVERAMKLTIEKLEKSKNITNEVQNSKESSPKA